MSFIDGTEIMADARELPDGAAKTIYSFVLKAPAVPLAELEGAHERQRRTLATELAALRGILEADD